MLLGWLCLDLVWILFGSCIVFVLGMQMFLEVYHMNFQMIMDSAIGCHLCNKVVFVFGMC